MRDVLYGAACSLDGYIAGPSGEVDWLHWSQDVADITNEVWRSIDTVLMGRKTYEVAVRLGTTSYPGVENYVFSRTMPRHNSEVTIVRDDAAEFVRELVQSGGKGICVMGGGQLARALFAAGLITRVGLNVQPILLGAGTPMFPAPGPQLKLALEEARPLDGGCYYLLYRVSRNSA